MVADSVSLARLGAEWGTTNPWTCRAVTITSIDFVKRPEVMRALEALVWDAVVFDEAHGLTGRSDRALAAGALARRARTVVLLTATPHAGDDRAFETLCGIGDLGRAFPLLTFRRTRSDGHVGVASVRIARVRWRHLSGRTRRGERSAASGSTISHGRRNDARASRFARSWPRTSRTHASMPGDRPVMTHRSSRMRTVSPGASDEERTHDDNAWPVPRRECAERSQVRSRML